MKDSTILLLSILMLSSGYTQTGQSQNLSKEKNKIINVDLNKEYPKKDIVIQDIAEVEYIPLETHKDGLLKYSNIDVITDELIITHDHDGNIFVFNRKGKFLNSFNRTGGAGHEYSSLQNLCFDNKTKEIFVDNFGIYRKIYVYTLDGKFKRKFDLPEKVWPDLMINYNNDYLLCYDNYEVKGKEPNALTKNKPYYFVSKKDGKITLLNLEIPNKISNSITIYKGDQTILTSINIQPLMKNSSEILLSDFACDTVYSLKGTSRIPIMTKKPSIQKNEAQVLFSIHLLSDRYILMGTVNRKFNEENPNSKEFGYDRIENKFYKFCFLNTDIDTKKDSNMDNKVDLPLNFALNDFQAEKLIELNEKGQLKGKLKEVASKLEPDDNPVLMLVKFNSK